MGAYRESYIFRIETDDPATVWSGHTDLILPADTVLFEDTVALGGGELVSLPELEQLINGVAQRADIVLSGVNENTMRIAREEADQVPGAAVYIGRVSFDEDWRIESVVWEWAGEGVNLSVAGDPEDESGRSRSLTLRVAAGDTTRSRAPFSFFTHAEQIRDFPDDDFFSHVAGINAGTSRRWGPS